MRDDGLIEEIVEDLWDCTSCDKKSIAGRELSCPACANGREQSEAYRAGSGAVVTDPKLLALANAGANWACPYCGMDNRAELPQCGRCSATRGRDDPEPVVAKAPGPDLAVPLAGAFALLDAIARPLEAMAASEPEAPRIFEPITTQLSRLFKKLVKFVATCFLGLLLFWLAAVAWVHRSHTGTVEKLEWQRHVFLERNEPVIETSWDKAPENTKVLKSEVVPDGGGYRTEITGYKPGVERWMEKVSDGQESYSEMETVPDGEETYTENERVQDGFTTTTRTIQEQTGTRKELAREEKLGNGFTRKLYREVPVYSSKNVEEKVPAYRDVPVTKHRPKFKQVAVEKFRPKFKDVERTKPIQIPITRQVPVPRTRITYERRSWRTMEPLVEKGEAGEPKWPEVKLAGEPNPEHEISRRETYLVHFDEGNDSATYYPKSFAEFQKFKKGDVRTYRRPSSQLEFTDGK